MRIDVTQEQSVLDALAEAESNLGKLHIACNNAGVPMHGTRLVDVRPEDWEFVIGVNIWGVIRCVPIVYQETINDRAEGFSLRRLQMID